MAVMTNLDRIAVGALFQSDASRDRESLGVLLKSDIQAAIVAIDEWIVANTLSFNSAFPIATRTALSPQQKARLLKYVISQRYKVGV